MDSQITQEVLTSSFFHIHPQHLTLEKESSID